MSITQASIGNHKLIVNFIKKYWSKNHVLVKNKKLFYYYYVRKKKINFLILKYKNELVSILGYLVNHYKREKYIWLALWTSKPNEIFSGVRLLKNLEEKFDKKILVLGLSEYATKILKQLNYKILPMNHYYFVNNEVFKFKIIKNPLPNRKFLLKKNQSSFEELKKINIYKYNHIISQKKFRNFKDFKFKYIDNKFYNYQFYLLRNKNQKLLIVTRKILVKQKVQKVIRIIDAFGNYNLFKYTTDLFLELLKDKKIEYIDLINYGISPKIFLYSGMNKINYDTTIVPNYFEPFKRKNKKIHFAYQNELKKKLIIFKGDGDQERPNLI